MNRSAIRSTLVTLTIGAAIASSVAEAQWVLLARRAIGRVEQMSQQQPNGGAAYVSAAVMIEVPGEKGYAVAVRKIEAGARITVTEQNRQQRLLPFTHRRPNAGPP